MADIWSSSRKQSVPVYFCSFPQCVLCIKGQTYTKVLSEEDLRYLAGKNFADWKNFVITRHFRMELDIGQEKPLPKIVEVTRHDEDFDD